jgi:cytochrome c peroxidase
MKLTATILILLVLVTAFAFRHPASDGSAYAGNYYKNIYALESAEQSLLQLIRHTDVNTTAGRNALIQKIHETRLSLKATDFWTRYLLPETYKKLNGPLPVEWENEVFEKYEQPYRLTGAGLSLAEIYLTSEEEKFSRDTLIDLIGNSLSAITAYRSDSLAQALKKPDHFFLANRLFLLNLAAIYTTSFDNPDTSRVIPELRFMLQTTATIYKTFDQSFPDHPISVPYHQYYDQLIRFVDTQPDEFSRFDHFTFIRDYINPLFRFNQEMIQAYGISSRHYYDYALSDTVHSLFDKGLFTSHQIKGVYAFVDDPKILSDIKDVGRLLFYDPILSGNLSRSCASCHRPDMYFTDTTRATPFLFNHQGSMTRNAPTLINSVYNHLLMADGRHMSLQLQGKEVMGHPNEMNGIADSLVDRVMSCKEYESVFRRLLRYTPEEKKVNIDHIISAITYYYAGFSQYYAPFDDVFNKGTNIDSKVKAGFNVFMSKAKCGTCHFVPHFNGLKPPYLASEFEVLGVPADTSFKQLSPDSGRYAACPAPETLHAFRTGSLRNISHTAPYMHNGIFGTLDQVLQFYEDGGGAGRGLVVPNQTLDKSPLKLTDGEKKELLAFLGSLTETVIFDKAPAKLPLSKMKKYNNRKIGGDY